MQEIESIAAGVPEHVRGWALRLLQMDWLTDEPRLYSEAIEAAVDVTQSEIGYFHLVNEDQRTIELGTWSAGTLARCQAVYERHYPIDQAGVWADCARFRQPQIHNDYQSLVRRRGYPEGHVPLVRHLGVPVLADGRVVLLVGVGNKLAPYERQDVDRLQFIAETAWHLIDRRRRVARLELAERHLQDIQALAGICVWEWDPDERRLAFDANAYRIFGLDRAANGLSDVDGLLRFIDATDRQAVLEALSSPGDEAFFDIQLQGVRADGAPLTLQFRGAACPRPQGHGLLLRGILQDITQRLELSRVQYLANHDALTGLANRQALMQHLKGLLRNQRRKTEDCFAVLFIDLDGFKQINDEFGHLVGDEVLRLVAERLSKNTRREDFLARLGGDEFIVVQANLNLPEAATALAGKIIAALQAPMSIHGRSLGVGASIGIALAQEGSFSPEDIIARADQAMYRAKEAGKGGYHLA